MSVMTDSTGGLHFSSDNSKEPKMTCKNTFQSNYVWAVFRDLRDLELMGIFTTEEEASKWRFTTNPVWQVVKYELNKDVSQCYEKEPKNER